MLRYLFEIACLAPFTASFSLFLEFCLQDGNIFGRYGNWIEHKSYGNYRIRYWLKPIGGCVFCLGVYVFIAFFLCFFALSNQISQIRLTAFCTLLGIGLNHLLIGAFKKITD